MAARNWVIASTEREGLLYQNLLALHLHIKTALNLHNRLRRHRRIRDYCQENETVKLHLGCGDQQLEGFLNSDLLNEIPIDIRRRLPLADASVDLIYSNHLLEHLWCREAAFFIRESWRVLKPGGKHIIATPSLQKLALLVYSDDPEKQRLLHFHQNLMEAELDPATFLNRVMHINYGHRFLHDGGSIRRLALKAGFRDISRVPNRKVPDDIISRHLATQDEIWDLETDTFVLLKENAAR